MSRDAHTGQPASSTTPPIRVRGWAKLNLMLRVGPPLPPGQPFAGYHPIASWMHAIDLFDEIEVAPLPAGSPSAYHRRREDGRDIDWPEETDLAIRAHKLLQLRTGKPLAIRMSILKRIPAGAGLGGGSSDAAAALQGISDCYPGVATPQSLIDVARELGSDIRFFQSDPGAPADRDAPPLPAIIEGVGDRVTRLTPRHDEVVLIFPPFGCETRRVYAAARPHAPIDRAAVLAAAATAQRLGTPGANDLFDPACRIEPRLDPLVRQAEQCLERAGIPAVVSMSGSGSTLWLAPAPGSTAATTAAALCAALPAEVRVLATRLV